MARQNKSQSSTDLGEVINVIQCDNQLVITLPWVHKPDGMLRTLVCNLYIVRDLSLTQTNFHAYPLRRDY